MHHEGQPHPIHTYLTESIHQSLTEEDRLFWKMAGYEPDTIPEKIIIATASTRKLLMSNALLNFDLNTSSFRFSKNVPENYRKVFKGSPLDLQKFFLDHIPNGNGSYKEGPILLGYYHGVPVYGESTEGETKRGTDPIKQANLKAKNLAKKYRAGVERVIVVSGDSIERIGEERKPHGKPSGDFKFRSRKRHESKGDYDREKEAAFRTYLERYVQDEYGSHEITSSIAGISAYSLNPDKKRAQIKKIEVEFPAKFALMPGTAFSWKQGKTIVADKDAAGGGVTQQVIDWEGDFWDHPNGALWKWIIYCQIAGAPIFSMLGTAVEAGSKKRRRAHSKQ